MDKPLLVATDGTAASMGGLRVARSIAERDGRPVVALAVLEPLMLPAVGASYPLVVTAPTPEDGGEARLRGLVAEQLREVGVGSDRWTLEVEVGSPAATIVRRAHELDASLIVLGLGRHEAADRLLGSETALKVIHLAHLPVLACHPHARALPARALVATDFSEFARDAAHLAARLAHPNGELHLAHVAWAAPEGGLVEREVEWLETYRVGALARLDELRGELSRHGPQRIATTLLGGETARALLNFARLTNVDLIATGSHGHGFLGRIMMGSVSTRVLRQANCSVLVSPPRTVAVEVLRFATPAERRPEEPALAG
jgi:nucleotide-binding universal stress UspA family protein